MSKNCINIDKNKKYSIIKMWRIEMLAKYWKRIGMIILIIACIWNLVVKVNSVISFDGAMELLKYQIQVVGDSIRK